MTDAPLPGFVPVGRGPRRAIVLGGWFGRADEWAPLHPAIDGERFSFAFVDYRGYGRSLQLPGRYGFEEAAGDVLRLADALRWERFALVGHSMGAMAAQRVLLAAPQRVERLVAVSGVPARGSRMPAERLAEFRRAVDDVALRAAIIQRSTGGRTPPAWAAHMAELSWRHSLPAAFAAYLAEWTGSGFEDALRGQWLPVDLLVGEHDPTLNAAAMEAIWRPLYPQARLQVLAGVGHCAMQEAPLALAAALQASLDG